MNEAQFNRYYRDNYRRVVYQLYALLGDYHAAEDVAQAVFLRISAVGLPVGIGVLVYNAAVDYWRMRKVEPVAKVDLRTVESYPDLTGDILDSLIDPIDQSIVRLLLAGDNQTNIAERLGVTPQSVSYRVRRLRERLRK